jgi:hypothetical protein
VQAPKGVKERVKSPNSENFVVLAQFFFFFFRVVFFFSSRKEKRLCEREKKMCCNNSAKYNRTERLCDFSHGGLLRTFYAACFARVSCNCSIRLVTRTKEFNWSASRSNFSCNFFCVRKCKRRSESNLVRRELFEARCITGTLRTHVFACQRHVLLLFLRREQRSNVALEHFC